MTQSELVVEIAEELGVNRTEAKKALTGVLKCIGSGVRSSKKLSLPGFGNFKIETRAARTGRNPQTGAPLQIPAKDIVKFKAQF